ncbi:hypothetical protein K491DRAFT_774522 [Lophiostoma macrostomum CBS 122681]|uniref:Uncharacterized protein n=1 Tax=Lophiostoma macrostomum CBS 122681 TaxID=1314788 RepID=A0A6A6TMQ6_9PLEO|nr:hypothetical protein K491DRAFT_774522 [Lophiostoma macrostomum CBS 122681]
MEIYDNVTGQVFVETSMPVRSMVSNWMNESTGKRDNPSTYLARGASLQDMALRSCIWHIDICTPETLAEVPWHLAAKIYDRMVQMDTITLNSWAVFKMRYPAEVEATYSKSVYEDSRGPVQLPSIIAQIRKMPFACLTLLSIDGLILSINSLMLLLDLPSLAVLHLEDVDRIHNRIFGNWTRAIKEKQAFPNLQVLLLGCLSFNHDITGLEIALTALDAFPKLAMVQVDAMFRYAARRYLDLPPEQQIFCEGRWTRISDQGDIRPDITWKTPGLTREKLHALHKMAQNPIVEPSELAADTPALALHYVDRRNHQHEVSYPGRMSVWFAPAPEDKEESHHKEKSNGNGQQKGSSNKRPKIRHERQKDLGSMLGSFN